MPLEDGWAQLPFLNATEQVVSDILPDRNARARNTIPALFSGAAIFGTDDPLLFNPAEGEPPWNVAVSDASSYDGTWKFTKDGLTEISLFLRGPEVFIDGIFWLGKGTPTPEDALPTFDNWLDAAQPLPLTTPEAADSLPPPFVITFKTLTFTQKFLVVESTAPGSSTPTRITKDISTANLGSVEFAYAPNTARLTDLANVTAKPGSDPESTIYELLLATKPGPFDVESFWLNLPLVWRRHARSPAIQSVPMTQVKSPADYPGASRQLFPFTLPLGDGLGKNKLKAPGDWRFKIDGGSRWPTLASDINLEPTVKNEEFDGLDPRLAGLARARLRPQLERRSVCDC